jgi:hypothetical protein
MCVCRWSKSAAWHWAVVRSHVVVAHVVSWGRAVAGVEQGGHGKGPAVRALHATSVLLLLHCFCVCVALRGACLHVCC